MEIPEIKIEEVYGEMIDFIDDLPERFPGQVYKVNNEITSGQMKEVERRLKDRYNEVYRINWFEYSKTFVIWDYFK